MFQWVTATFQERNKLCCIRIHGESGAADHAVIDAAVTALLAVIARHGLNDMYNMDKIVMNASNVLYMGVLQLMSS
ncbi:hypothetical protein Plhal304r1_c057g0142931 [Plasmopara halstedii]